MSEASELFVCNGCHRMCNIGIKYETISIGCDDYKSTTKVIRLTQNGQVVHNYTNKLGYWHPVTIVSIRNAKNVANLFTANCAYFKKIERTR